ncbi:MAG: hypothetical protein K9M81_03245 [Chthoniobacterales bacterium]|nr:hypothetical protein [Chthoniobacterales bacterium]
MWKVHHDCVDLELLLRWEVGTPTAVVVIHQPSRPPHHDQYEISGRVQIISSKRAFDFILQ